MDKQQLIEDLKILGNVEVVDADYDGLEIYGKELGKVYLTEFALNYLMRSLTLEQIKAHYEKLKKHAQKGFVSPQDVTPLQVSLNRLEAKLDSPTFWQWEDILSEFKNELYEL